LDSDSTLVLAFVIVSWLAFGALRGARTVQKLIRRVDLRDHLSEDGMQSAAVKGLRSAATDYQQTIVVLQATAVAAGFSLGVVLLAVQRSVAWPWMLLVALAFGVVLMLLQALAAALVERLSQATVLRLSVAVIAALWPWRMLFWFGRWAVQRLFKPARDTASEAVQSVEEEIAEEPLEPRERAMIHAILHLEETLVREIMVPRVDMVAVDIESTLEQAIELVSESGHSRVPAYRDTLDNMVGVLYGRDLLKLASPDSSSTMPALEQLVRPCFFVPESKRADELLQELQERHIHIAVVVDEYGGVAGLVTIEDLLEEIVGEIEDEFDTSEAAIEAMDGGMRMVDARISLDAFNAAFSSSITGEGFDTLGGFLSSQLGRIPSPGDQVQSNGLRFEVYTTLGRRVKKVRVKQVDEAPDGDEDATH
jgi:putative hemolysin